MADRKMPDTWFRASPMATTIAFLTGTHRKRAHPLQEGERALGPWLVLPPFQRPPVWTRDQQIRFVESCWMALPIGAFVFNEGGHNSPYDNWLLDGQQRVTALYAYMADEFPVMGYRFSELGGSDYRRWDMTVHFPCLKTNLEDEHMLLEIYDRLAYGGTAHEPR